MMRFVSAFAAMMAVAGAWPGTAWALGDAPVQTSAFLEYCKTHTTGCTNEIGMVSFGLLTNMDDRSWCPTKEVADVNALTPKVVQWMTAHPETYGTPTVEGIEAALKGAVPRPVQALSGAAHAPRKGNFSAAAGFFPRYSRYSPHNRRRAP